MRTKHIGSYMFLHQLPTVFLYRERQKELFHPSPRFDFQNGIFARSGLQRCRCQRWW